ncbi:hypothetical protein NC652_016196 [Populus alba x Populus x berolinensis]|nr:hypothetical protein NC652_016196 [Populus alba x Populus x berolinensis]
MKHWKRADSKSRRFLLFKSKAYIKFINNFPEGRIAALLQMENHGMTEMSRGFAGTGPLHLSKSINLSDIGKISVFIGLQTETMRKNKGAVNQAHE